MSRPTSVAKVYNGTAPGVDTDILSAHLTPGATVAAFRVTVALTTSSVFNVAATDGTTPHVWGLNESNALNAADLYTFVFGVHKDLSYNFQVETDSVIEVLLVEEIHEAVL